MRLLLLILACGFFSLGGHQNAYAQSARSGAHSDRLFQRWLPPPEGAQANVADQVRLLELLGRQVAASPNSLLPPQPPLPELTDAQLRQLDKVYQAWSEHSGGAPLPDWDSLPKEWADKALANPQQLQQAQRLIQQYTRQRKLPQPGSVPGSVPSTATDARDGVATPATARPQPDDSRASQVEDSPPGEPTTSSHDSTSRASPSASIGQPPGSRRSSSGQPDPRRSRSQSSSPASAQARDPRAQSAETPTDESAKAEPERVTSGGAESDAGAGGAGRAGIASPDSAAAPAEATSPRTPASSRAPKGSSSRDTQPAAGGPNSRSNPGEVDVLGASGALKQQLMENGARATSQPPGAGVRERPSSDQPSGSSDAVRLKALRELWDELKAVQAAREARSAEAHAAATGAGSHSARNRTHSSREANAREREPTARNRTAQNSATTRGAPAPSMAGNQFPQRSMGQPPRSLANQPRPTSETPPAPIPAEQKNNDGFNAPQIQDLASESDIFHASGGQSGGVSERDTFDVAPMLESVVAAPTISRLAEQETLRSSARRAATQRSFDSASTASRSAGWSSSAAPTNSALRSVDLPKLASEINTGFSSGRSQSEIQASIKRDIERFGLEKTLRRIIETTFQEEPHRAGSSQALSPIASAVGRSLSGARPNPSRNLNVDAATTQRSDKASSNSRLAGIVADVWKAIATAPASNSVASSSSAAASSAASKGKSNAQLAPNGYQVPIALLAIAAVALAVWISRKRPAFFRAERVLDTRWAEAALAEGIRTRTDVIRAFHRLASQATEPVASWWTHRYVARRLVESTPQLSAALSDLSSVYEQARYMPPEADLSAEQIRRVCMALRECAAYGNRTASASA